MRHILTIICLLAVNVTFANNQNLGFFKSWTDRALKLQREIDLNVPLHEATFVGTHNSYNAKDYQQGMLRYLDPNQNLSIYRQLELGIRSIELDVHWTYTSHFSKDLLLCHGMANSLGCSVFDRKVSEGLEEIRDWLRVNPREIILLYIEHFLDGHEKELADELNTYLGEFIYKPENQFNVVKGCTSLSSAISKADILKSGKQLIIVSKGCKPNDVNLNKLIFSGIGSIPNHDFTFIDSTLADTNGAIDCSILNIFADDTLHNSLWRIFEDRTMLSDIVNKRRNLSAMDIHTLIQCGINWPALDMLAIGDDRLKALVWSWTPGYPQEGLGNCAILQQGEGIKNTSCSTKLSAYACQEKSSHQFKLVNQVGEWQNGEFVCQSIAGKNWHFAVPVNGNQMAKLKFAMLNISATEVWLNYRNLNNHWTANVNG